MIDLVSVLIVVAFFGASWKLVAAADSGEFRQ